MPEIFEFNVRAPGLIRKQLGPLAEAIARMIKTAIVDEMEEAEARSGRVYIVPGTAKAYTASAPGEPPAIREGRYREAWSSTKAVETGNAVIAAAVNDQKVGPYLLGVLLEEGSSDLVNFRVRMEPRPHIRPALERVRPDVEALIRRAT